MKPEFKPFKAKALASDWKTELADLTKWVPMEDEPMQIVRDIITFLVRDALLNMRGSR